MNAASDVVVLGAGPAGLCAAIRLLRMGRSVTILERPTPGQTRVGELLTPGVRSILDFLDVPDALQQAHAQEVVASRVIWPQPTVELLGPLPRQAGIMVDRALFDQHLLKAALAAGAVLSSCTVGRMVRERAGWRIGMDDNGHEQVITARFVVDARGRAGNAAGRVPLAARLLAICCEFPTKDRTCEVSVEALEDGWIWGAPTSKGTYRVLAFGDPITMRQMQPGHPSGWAHDMIGRSHLFRHLATAQASEAGAYNATSYLHRDWWGKDILKVGDAALALDPLSSSGVEKSMRFALQATLAINTLLANEGASMLAKQFLEARLYEACGRHMAWTRDQYANAWCADTMPFWRERSASQMLQGLPDLATHRISDAQTAAEDSMKIERMSESDGLSLHPLQLLDTPILAPEVGITDVACAMGDLIVTRLAVTHPGLRAPVAFVHGREVVPLLREIGPSRTYAELVERWTRRITRAEAIAICGWALRERLLVTAHDRAV